MKNSFKTLAFLLVLHVHVQAQEIMDSAPDELKGVSVEENLGAELPTDLIFTDQNGLELKLKDVLKTDKPTLLSLVYYECPMLCTLTLNGITDVIAQSKFKPGQDFHMLSISIDPEETPDLAVSKRKAYLNQFEAGKALDAKGEWPFLTGTSENILKLANVLGFNYRYIESEDEYAHPSAFYVISPGGKISRYFYGVKHDAKNFDLALVEAGEGKVGTTFDKFLLYCYRYDPDAKGYVLFAIRLMKLSGVLAMVAVFGMLSWFWKREEKVEPEASRNEENVA